MARLAERILIWLAVLVAIVALAAVAVNFVPGLSSAVPWLKISEEQPSGPKTPIDLAEDAMAAGDTRKALAQAQRAYDENSQDATVDNRAGNVALRAGDQAAAERYYLAGESADKTYPWNFIALGQLYQRQDKLEPADAQLRAATVAAPDMRFVHYDLGVVELQEHLYAAALADFEAELKRSPTYQPATIGRAEALDHLGRRAEALALYQRTGVTARPNGNKPTGKNAPQPIKTPALKVQPLVQPSPSPTATPTPTASPTATPTPSPTRIAIGAAQARTRAARLARLKQQHILLTLAPGHTTAPARPPWAGNAASTPPATPAPRPLAEVIADARGYLMGVGQDLNFTRALPPADPSLSTAMLQARLNTALNQHSLNIQDALQAGTAALLSGRLSIATSAFSAVADDAPRDWRGPYLAGLSAQASGDTRKAHDWFTEAADREQRPEAYTSLAILDVGAGDIAAAAAEARRASYLDPAYEPGRFVAGMMDLMQNNVTGAEKNLSAAVALGGAPSRTEYFLTALHQSVGDANFPGT